MMWIIASRSMVGLRVEYHIISKTANILELSGFKLVVPYRAAPLQDIGNYFPNYVPACRIR